MIVYRTKDGDTLDWICWRHYGQHGALETVLEHNPGLAELGAILPRDVRIRLPDIPNASNGGEVSLWE